MLSTKVSSRLPQKHSISLHRVTIDQAPRARNRRMIGRRLVHGQPQKAADRQRVRRRHAIPRSESECMSEKLGRIPDARRTECMSGSSHGGEGDPWALIGRSASALLRDGGAPMPQAMETAALAAQQAVAAAPTGPGAAVAHYQMDWYRRSGATPRVRRCRSSRPPRSTQHSPTPITTLDWRALGLAGPTGWPSTSSGFCNWHLKPRRALACSRSCAACEGDEAWALARVRFRTAWRRAPASAGGVVRGHRPRLIRRSVRSRSRNDS